MARTVKDITITAEGRDNGKLFRITEKPALVFDKWLVRAGLALGKSGANVDDEFRKASNPLDAVAHVAIRSFAGVEFADAEPLMDEMMDCIEFIPSPRDTTLRRKIFDGDVEDVETLWFLRGEVLEVHTGFTGSAALSSLGTAVSDWMTSLLIRMYQTSSDASSEVASPLSTSLPPSTD